MIETSCYPEHPQSGPGPEPVAAAPKVGFWAFAYVARLDLTMLLLVTFLLVTGAGAYAVDAWLLKRLTAKTHSSMVRLVRSGPVRRWNH